MYSVKANLYVLLKMIHATYACMLWGFPSIAQFPLSRSDVVSMYTAIHSGVPQQKSLDCQIYTRNSSRERMPGEACLKKSPGYYVKLTLTTKAYCTVPLTIPILVTVKTQILLCTSWSNVPTLRYKMHLASILSISCNIQHLAQQQSQHKLLWPILRKRTFRYFRWVKTPNRPRVWHDVVITRMKVRTASRQKQSDPLGHCSKSNRKRKLQRRNDPKCTV